MPARNLDATFFVERPTEIRFEDGTIIAEIGSGRWKISLAMSVPTFLGSYAKAGLVALEIREKQAKPKRGRSND